MKENKIIKFILIIIVIAGISIYVGFYIGNSNFQKWVNINILKKEIYESNIPQIEFENKENSKVITYGKYLAILNNNELKIYDYSGNLEKNINVNISKPICARNKNYLLIGDSEGTNLYLIYNLNLQWKKTVDGGNISKLAINMNGDASVVLTGTTYKSVILMYNLIGDEKFKTYLSESNVEDLTLSEDGKNLSYIEIDTSGTMIKSRVKTISIVNAIKGSDKVFSNTYEFDDDILLLKIKYNNDDIIVLSNDGIYKLKNNNKNKLLEINDQIKYLDIDMHGFFCYEVENEKENIIKIYNIKNDKQSICILDSNIKSLKCSNSYLAIEMGNKLSIINSKGWYKKEYYANENIKDVSISDKIIAVVFKNKIEIFKL